MMKFTAIFATTATAIHITKRAPPGYVPPTEDPGMKIGDLEPIDHWKVFLNLDGV